MVTGGNSLKPARCNVQVTASLAGAILKRQRSQARRSHAADRLLRWHLERPDDGTHIHRICQAGRAALPDPENVYYSKGVGLEPGMRLSGAALGKGLSENVREAYRWLVRHHADGAEIYIFGFSRGAYTARSLSGLMNYAGLLQPQDEGSIGDAYEAYRFRQHERVRTRFHHGAAHGRSRQVRVRFLGVFDTVGALGLPLDWVKRITADLPHLNLQFHDTRLCGNVDVACQALAIDERRGPYEPTWWEAPAPGACHAGEDPAGLVSGRAFGRRRRLCRRQVAGRGGARVDAPAGARGRPRSRTGAAEVAAHG